ncbi:hypothetical protein DFH07DRAFT_852733 [Mycena maculata]|uniref:DUF6533 domain-containing protein n=1 Tax=Mycena maculata TaxID=230809 RepID=A0AAD7MP77_9AGAR|nr:hypothetical protein DFH07DRAFT_852733 [Mycena maculata]
MSDGISAAVALSWSRLQTVKYVNVASLAILVFDYCLTFDLEVSLMWKSRLTLSKILFMLARYTPFFDVPVGLSYVLAPNVPLKHCFNLNVVATTMSVFGIAIGEAILVLRTYALSGRNRKVLIVFTTIYAVEVLATLIMISLFLRSMIFGPPILAAIPGCNETGGNLILVGVCFIMVLVNETVLTIYTLWLGFKRYRSARNEYILILYRDGIVYFLFLFACSAANCGILIAGAGELQELLPTFLRVMHSVLSTRILLHVRDVERRREEASFLDQAASGTRIDFASDIEEPQM